MASSPYRFRGLCPFLASHFGAKKVGVGSRLEGGNDPCVQGVGFICTLQFTTTIYVLVCPSDNSVFRYLYNP